MLLRVVRLRLRDKEAADRFEALFSERRSRISSQPGCSHLELWQDAHEPLVFFTYSHWESEADLDRYRFSAFFKETWGLTKALFGAEKAQAWSVTRRD